MQNNSELLDYSGILDFEKMCNKSNFNKRVIW